MVPSRASTVRHWTIARDPPAGASPTPQEADVHAAALLAAEAEETASALPPAVVGLAAFGILVALLVVTYAFRNAGHRNQ